MGLRAPFADNDCDIARHAGNREMFGVVFSLLRLIAVLAVVNMGAVGASVLIASLIHAAEATDPSTPAAQVAQQSGGRSKKAEVKSPMARCLESWDRTTQMSKQEWKETCKRTVKENPGLFDKAY